MNPWLILAFVLAVGAAAGGGYYQGNMAGKAKVEQAWDKERAEQFAVYAKEQEEARLREQELQADLRRAAAELSRSAGRRIDALEIQETDLPVLPSASTPAAEGQKP